MTDHRSAVEAPARRALFFGLTLFTAYLASLLMLDILRANGLTVLECLGLILFFVLFTWISGAFWTAVAGFVIRLIGRDHAVIHPEEVAGRPLQSRTAIIMPIYNEDVARVSAGLDSIWTSLKALPEQGAFDLFILSDTRIDEIGRQEEAAWRSLVARHGAQGRIFYRRRADNVGRKAGNVADFVRNWGGAYDYMIVLDADSIMTGDALVTLARLMDAHPKAGIMQTLPFPAGRDTLLARLVQFACRINGPMLASGLAFWQLGEGNYWGHNAIIRVQAFATHCALPKLPGKAPLGGEILSHDFVEAAFIRRAGYEVWMVPDLEGSWEQVPSNLIDFAARDRRWTQGNLQHAKVLSMRGLHWISRLHMLTGILAYATSPIWLVVLILASIVTCWEAIHGHQYFEPGIYTLFPNWPEGRASEIASLLTVTIVVLLLPKVLGTILTMLNPTLRRGFGGAPRLMVSLLIEQVFSMLLAPAMMLFHSSFVIQTLRGRPVSWNAQDRSDRGINLREAFARHKWHFAIGVGWGALIWLLAPDFIYWMLPVLAGLLMAVPLTMWTSQLSLGRRLRDWGLLVTPEETNVPRELAAISEVSPIESVNVPPVVAAALSEHAEPVPARAPLHMEPQPVAYLGVRSTVDAMWRGTVGMLGATRRAL